MDEYEDIKTPEQKAMKAMEEVNEHKTVSDKVLKKERKPLTPEQKKHQAIYDREFKKRMYSRSLLALHKEKHKDVIDYTKNSGKSPTQIYIELVRKELNK